MLGITSDTRLSRVLDALPGALDYIISLNPHDFERLRNPLMRKYMSPRIKLARVAAMAGMTPESLIQGLVDLGSGEVSRGEAPPDVVPLPQSPGAQPEWMADVRPEAIHWVDVTPIDDVLGDPIPPINTAVRRMAPDSVLGIRHRWEPQPLYDVWQKMGIEWYTIQIASDEWRIFVYKPPTYGAPDPKESVMVDLRHLPPAEGAPRVSAMFEQLSPGHWVEVWAKPESLEPVRRLMDGRHPGEFDWDEEDRNPEKQVVRIVVRQPG